jgi:hypothetical protein
MEQLRQVEIITGQPRKNFEGEVVKPKTLLGCFHGWEDYKSDDLSCKYAIVELESGDVERYEPTQIKFTGKPCGAAMFEEGLMIAEVDE